MESTWLQPLGFLQSPEMSKDIPLLLISLWVVLICCTKIVFLYIGNIFMGVIVKAKKIHFNITEGVYI